MFLPIAATLGSAVQLFCFQSDVHQNQIRRFNRAGTRGYRPQDPRFPATSELEEETKTGQGARWTQGFDPLCCVQGARGIALLPVRRATTTGRQTANSDLLVFTVQNISDHSQCLKTCHSDHFGRGCPRALLQVSRGGPMPSSIFCTNSEFVSGREK